MRFLGWSLLGLAVVLALYVGPAVALGAAWPGLPPWLEARLPAEWWHGAARPVTLWPVWAVPAALGVLFLLLGRLARRA